MPEYRGNHYAIYEVHHINSWRDGFGRSQSIIEKTERRFSLRVHYTDLWYEEFVVPNDRFVTYEPSDIQWLQWAGDAYIKRFPIQPGVKFNAKRLTGEDVVIYVNFAPSVCTLEDGRYKIECRIGFSAPMAVEMQHPVTCGVILKRRQLG